MRTLLVSFIYPKIEGFLREFFNSLKNQTTKEFDSLIFNDHYYEDLKKFGFNGVVLKNLDNLNIIQIRKLIIDYTIENNYDLLIFADADDIMAQDRIKKIIESYNDNISFFYNDLYLLSNMDVDFYKGQLPNSIDNLEKIKEFNFLGMTNTAINIRKEKEILEDIPITNKLIAFDWYLYSYLLLNKGYGVKVNSKTYYRIYGDNTAGFTNYLTDKKLGTGLKVKKYHYDFMKQFDETYEELLDEIIRLEEKLQNPQFKEKYIKYVNSKYSDSVYWWENIKTLDKFEKGAFDDKV